MPAEAKWRLLDVGTGSGLGLAPGLALLSCGGQQQQPAVLTLIEPSQCGDVGRGLRPHRANV